MCKWYIRVEILIQMEKSIRHRVLDLMRVNLPLSPASLRLEWWDLEFPLVQLVPKDYTRRRERASGGQRNCLRGSRMSTTSGHHMRPLRCPVQKRYDAAVYMSAYTQLKVEEIGVTDHGGVLLSQEECADLESALVEDPNG